MGISDSLKSYMRWRWKICRITFLSLFYNEHISSDYIFDTLMAPAFYFVDQFTAILGPLFVALVFFLTTSVVFIAYWIGLPYYLQYKNFFHFLMALTLSPGKPPTDTLLEQVSSICKKCISPKPPRTHHCSVCKTCILKMDHHCPWLNNCVGHYNHRHFFLYMVFMVVGCSFIMINGFEIFFEEFYDNWWGDGSTNLDLKYRGQNFGVFTRRSLVFYEAFMSSACFVSLGGLCLWHARLINAGQTSIEAHINRSEAKRMAELGKIYKNPYNFGSLYNWYLFLGLVNGRGWLSILFPSRHKPLGDGLSWDSIYSSNIKFTYGSFRN